MTDYVQGASRRQTLLLPDTLDDYVPPDSAVRFIDAFVDGLNMGRLGFVRAEPPEMGRPAYDPRDLLKLYLYGYLNIVRSSRRLERECHRNIELVWLLKKLAPDFKTIADFRSQNPDPIRQVFREMVKLYREMGLLDDKLVGIDGTKLKAVNAISRHLTPEKLEEQMRTVDKAILRYLKELDENDRQEEHLPPERIQDLKKKIDKLRKKQQELEEVEAQMASTGEKEVSRTDPDSRVMPIQKRSDMGYNAQTAVEAKNRLVVEYDVSNCAADHKELAPMALAAKEALGVETLAVTADKGYYGAGHVNQCQQARITCYIPRPEKGKGAAQRLGISPGFHRDDFHYDSTTDTFVCPAGARMNAWAPNPQMQNGVKTGVMMVRYHTSACHTCMLRAKCTSSPRGRSIARREDDSAVDAMNERMKTWKGRKMVEVRKTLCEHPFGTIKRGFGQRDLLLKGLRKVNGEVGLTMMAYDMRRVLNLVGTLRLMEALTSRAR